MNNKITIFEKNMNAVQKECIDIAQKIREVGYCPDLVVFVAQSGFLFAKPMAEHFGCTMASITVKRPGNSAKDMLRKVIRMIPQQVLFAVLKSRHMYSYNDSHEEREVKVNDRFIALSKQKKYKKILLVDDSTDTGLSLLKSKEVVEEYFPDAEIRTFCYCVISLSEKRIKVDYMNYRDTIVVTATSRYSKEYDMFMNALAEWNKTGL